MDNVYREMTREEFEFYLDRKKKQKKYRALGVVVMLLAALGVILSIVFCAQMILSSRAQKKEDEINSYNSLLIPVAAVDPAGFDDVASAPMNELLEIALWSIIGSGLDPNSVSYSDGSIVIPAATVEAAFTGYFGSGVAPVHATVEGYGYRFTYSPDDTCYYIPTTGIAPVYTPSVASVEKKNGVVTVVCGLVYAGSWQQDMTTGKMVSADPDKYITVIIRQQSGGYYIGAITSAAKPETALS